MSPVTFPDAQQAQIIRAHQRDLFHVSSLKESVETVARSWLGTRWLSRWDKELELLTKLVYYGLCTGRGNQTLGEEYVDIWQHSVHTRQPPQSRLRAALVLVPNLSAYLLAKGVLGARLRNLSSVIEILAEINLALFYLGGSYYDLTKRLLGIKKISTTLPDPRIRPPSYSLLGILILVRLGYRLRIALKGRLQHSTPEVVDMVQETNAQETWLDDTPVSTLLHVIDPDSAPAKPAEEDTRTMLDVASIPEDARQGRNCTLCLEERTDSCATECGHLFCWPCIVGWGREKAECPLCRQSLSLTNLLPVYNL